MQQLRAIFERDGVIGAAFDAWMLQPGWVSGQSTNEGVTLNTVVDHIDHVCQLAGNSHHAGIGTDLDGGYGREQSPCDLDTIADLQKLAGLLARSAATMMTILLPSCTETGCVYYAKHGAISTDRNKRRKIMSADERSVIDLFSLQGRVAVVTGACGWLGSAMSRALAEAGAQVVVTSRDGGQAAEFAASLRGDGHLGLGFSQGDTDTIPGFVTDVVERMGKIDVLVNNAYGGTAPDIDSATAEDFNQTYHVGVTAYFLLARDVMLHLRGAGASRIDYQHREYVRCCGKLSECL